MSFLFCFRRVVDLRCNITSSVAQAKISSLCVEGVEQSVLCPFRLPLRVPPHLLLLPSYFFPPDPPLSLRLPILVQLPFIRFSSTFPLLFSTPLPFFSLSGVPENIGRESYEWHERSGISKSFIICSGVVCVCVYVLGTRGGWPKEPTSSQTIAPLGWKDNGSGTEAFTLGKARRGPGALLGHPQLQILGCWAHSSSMPMTR